MIPSGAFPLLTALNHRITSPASKSYNCVAWAAGDQESWWWPDADGIGYWPAGVSREETLAAFVQAYQSLGYEICPHSEPEEGFEKVAVYVLDRRPTHVARQLPDGRWSSKLGPQEDIEHEYEVLEGPTYGTIVEILKRPRSVR